MIKLYDYYRSGAAFRVRIALNHKKLTYSQLGVHLLKNGGEQFSEQYRAINSQCLVPTLEDNGHIMTQSIAIMEYLEEQYPLPPLLPKGAYARAAVRSLAQMIACDIHPLNNLRVLNHLQTAFDVSQAGKLAWYQHWIHLGLSALEKRLAASPECGQCCFGDEPTMADMVLVPQLASAKRFNCSLEDYPSLVTIYEHCMALPAFADAAPDKQPDAE